MIALYAHPFSSYCWKAQIALDEKDVAFDYKALTPEHPENGAALKALWPIGKFPVLRDGDRTIVEATAIVEYLEVLRPEPPLIPDGMAGVEARMLDRVFDNYVMTPMNVFVKDAMKPADDPHALTEAAALLDQSYAWLEARLGDGWLVGDGFTLADVSAAPSLFYADWVRSIPESFARLRAYRARLLARESVMKTVEGARPYRAIFPPGAPDRD